MKFRTTVMLPKAIKQEMLSSIVQDGYGLRGKSKWVSEAVEKLLNMPNFMDYLKLAEEMSHLTEPEVIQISKDLREKLDDAIIQVRRNIPSLDGVQSSIIRTSIIQRILRKL